MCHRRRNRTTLIQIAEAKKWTFLRTTEEKIRRQRPQAYRNRRERALVAVSHLTPKAGTYAWLSTFRSAASQYPCCWPCGLVKVKLF